MLSLKIRYEISLIYSVTKQIPKAGYVKGPVLGAGDTSLNQGAAAVALTGRMNAGERPRLPVALRPRVARRRLGLMFVCVISLKTVTFPPWSVLNDPLWVFEGEPPPSSSRLLAARRRAS